MCWILNWPLYRNWTHLYNGKNSQNHLKNKNKPNPNQLTTPNNPFLTHRWNNQHNLSIPRTSLFLRTTTSTLLSSNNCKYTRITITTTCTIIQKMRMNSINMNNISTNNNYNNNNNNNSSNNYRWENRMITTTAITVPWIKLVSNMLIWKLSPIGICTNCLVVC